MINTTANKDELPPYSVNRLEAEAVKDFTGRGLELGLSLTEGAG
jgi:hypothetical protein